MAKDEGFKGYAARWKKAGEAVRRLDTVNACGECGAPMAISQEWRKSDDPNRTLYHIQGQCENGHSIERYGYGEAVTHRTPAAILKPKGVA